MQFEQFSAFWQKLAPGWLQKPTNPGVDLIFLQPTQCRPDDHTLPIQNQRERESARTISGFPRDLDSLQVTDKNGVVNRKFADERSHGFGLVNGNPDKLQAAATVFLLQAHENRDFLAARRAPRRPEVDDEDFSAPLPQILPGAAEVG